MGWLITMLGGPEGAALMLLKRCWGWLGKAWAWVAASTTHLLIAALLVSNLGWFVIHRIDVHSLAKCAKVSEQRGNALKANAAAARAQEATSTTIAETTDVHHTAALADARSAARAYAAAHRLQDRPVDPVAGSLSPVSADPAAMPFDVALRSDDLDACAADYAYAESAHENAISQVAAGVARWAD